MWSLSEIKTSCSLNNSTCENTLKFYCQHSRAPIAAILILDHSKGSLRLEVSAIESYRETTAALPTTPQQRLPNIYVKNDYPDTEDKIDLQCHFSSSTPQDSQ